MLRLKVTASSRYLWAQLFDYSIRVFRVPIGPQDVSRERALCQGHDPQEDPSLPDPPDDCQSETSLVLRLA